MRILSIDFGTKHTGIALGVDKTTTPLNTISTKNTDYLISEIVKLIDQEHIDLVVIGNPVNSDTKQSKLTKEFFDKLKTQTTCNIQLVDEYKSSKESFSNNFEKYSKLKKLKEKEHSLAAEQILKNYYLEH